MARNDPLRTFRYRLEIDNVTQVGFGEVAIAGTPIEAIDQRQRTDPTRVGKLSGLTKYGNVTLKRGVTGQPEGGCHYTAKHALRAPERRVDRSISPGESLRQM